jgi:hypothetical protein
MSNHGLTSNKKVAYSEYDFAMDGGVVGDIVLRGSVLPAGAVITNGYMDVETAVASGGAATLALKLVTAADLMPAMEKGNFPVNALFDLGLGGIGPIESYKTPTLTVGTAALTAGKFTLALEYIITR